MVQAQVLRPNVQINEVTERFQDAVSKLRPGELVKHDDFTLFEAVGALEIGDAKMDSGCLQEGEDLDDHFDFTRPLSAEEAIWLMDELAYREVAWHMGYPLSQTLFTSVHLDRLLWPEPKRLADADFLQGLEATAATALLREVVRPYCLGLIKSCDLVLDMVTSQHYYEEEDFAPQTFNRPLLHAFAVGDVRAALHQALSWLEEKDLQEEAREALLVRLRSRCVFFELLNLNASAKRPSQTQLQESTKFIQEIEKSAHLGRPLPEAFTLKIQRRLASSVPPRPMVVVERAEAFSFFQRLFTDSSTAFQVFDAPTSEDLLVAYWNFMSQKPQPAVYVRSLLQSFLDLNNKVLGSQPVKDFIFQDLRLLVLPASPLLDAANDAVEAPSDPRFQIASQLNQFVSRYGQSFTNIFRTYCLNRPRVRRTLCHAAIEWDQIQADAEDIDTVLQGLIHEQAILYPWSEAPTFSYPLSSWVYHYKLVQLRLIVQMGFELSVYAPYEYARMYWYLSHLCGTHLSHLERISYFVSSGEQQQKPKNKSKGQKDQAVQETMQQLYRHFSWLKATETLAKALHRLFIFLQRHGHFAPPSPTYASDELRFELRMRPFMHLSIPEPLTYEEVDQSTTLADLSDGDILDQAAKLSLAAKKAWEEVLREKWYSRSPAIGSGGGGVEPVSVVEREWTNNVRNTMKACIGASIAASSLNRIMQEHSLKKGEKENDHGDGSHDVVVATTNVVVPAVDDRERWHRFWAVPKL